MTDHDPMCPANRASIIPTGCRCDLIAKVRADEREHGAHTRQEGWLNTESHRKVVLADLRAQIEVLPGNDPFQNPERRAAYEYAISNVLDLIDGDSSG